MFENEEFITAIKATIEAFCKSNTEWAKVEIKGHRTHFGTIEEVDLFGVKFAHVRDLQPDGSFVEHYYEPGALFSICPLSEKEVRSAAIPFSYTRCEAYTQPSANPGQCAKCGRPEEHHPEAPGYCGVIRNVSIVAVDASVTASTVVGQWWCVALSTYGASGPSAIYPTFERATERANEAGENYDVFPVDIVGVVYYDTNGPAPNAPRTARDVINRYIASGATLDACDPDDLPW